jgi:PiT family inorganic phosphate transporter
LTKATEIGYSLLLSPLFGRRAAIRCFLVHRAESRLTAPEGNAPPPLWIRGI